MINMSNFNASSKFECQIPSYKLDTKFEILCFANKARVLLLLTYVLNWYKFQSNVTFFCYHYNNESIESVHLVCHESYWHRNGNFFPLHLYNTRASYTQQ